MAPLALSDLGESRVCKVLVVRRGTLAPPALRVRPVQLVRKALRGPQESKDRLVLPAQRVLRVTRVQLDQLAHRVKLALPDRKGRRGCRVSLEPQGRRGRLARQERLDLKGLLDQLARLAEQR